MAPSRSRAPPALRLSPRRPLAAALLAAAALPALVAGAEEGKAAESGEAAAAAAAGGNEASVEPNDETKQLLDKLSIGMVADVVDERTFEIRESSKTRRKQLRLGNVAAPGRAPGASDEEHAARLEAAKGALGKLVGKQMVWWKAAPKEHQPPDEGREVLTVFGDAWLIDGRHVSGLLRDQGHLAAAEEYEEELARNILTADADEKKKKAYKELEDAMKESEKEKARQWREQVKAEQALEAQKREPIGAAGWFGLGVVGLLACGALLNFGRPEKKKKKVNLNRKRGPMERCWTRLKGA